MCICMCIYTFYVLLSYVIVLSSLPHKPNTLGFPTACRLGLYLKKKKKVKGKGKIETCSYQGVNEILLQ